MKRRVIFDISQLTMGSAGITLESGTFSRIPAPGSVMSSVPCPTCAAPTTSEAIMCSSCGRPNMAVLQARQMMVRNRQSSLVLAVGAMLFAFAIGGLLIATGAVSGMRELLGLR